MLLQVLCIDNDLCRLACAHAECSLHLLFKIGEKFLVEFFVIELVVILPENFGLALEHVPLEPLLKGGLEPCLHPWQHLPKPTEPLLPLNPLEDARVEIPLNDLHLMIH